MTGKILTRVYPNPPIDKKEVLRYAAVSGESEEILELLEAVVAEALPTLSGRVCYTEFDIKECESHLELGFTKSESKSLKAALAGCEKIILFAAPVGGEIDRLTSKYAITSGAKAVLLQALGAERIEAVADAFSEDIKSEAAACGYSVTKRFSPGYKDLSLALQKDIFSALDCPRKIGLTLGESLIMSPTKSITAIIGLKKNENH